MSSAVLTPEELRDAIRELLTAEGDLAVARLEPPRREQALDELWRKIAGLGWLGLGVEERYGGLGLGFSELGVLYEELGRHLSPLPVMTTLLASGAIAMGGEEAQRARWLPAIVAGSARMAVALPKALETVPRLDRNRVAVGTIRDVLGADLADELFVPVQDDRGLSLALVSRSDAAVQVVPCATFDLTRTLCEVSLRGVNVEEERLIRLGEPMWRSLLDHASVALACDAVGGAARILEDTVSYLGTRRQFDRALGSFQALKHRAASWKVMLEGAQALSRHAAELLSSHDEARSAVASCAKFSGCETYIGIAGEAVQLHGGIGFTWEHECHLFLKRARLNAVLFGSLIQHKERAAQFAFAEALAEPDPARRLLFNPSEPPAGAGA